MIFEKVRIIVGSAGADLGGGYRGCSPPLPEITCGFLIQLVFCKKKKKKKKKKKLCGLWVLN